MQRALYDELTRLPRRSLFLDRLQTALQACERNRTAGALLFIDIDRFKQINDQHGQAAGDAVLRCVAERLLKAVRGSDTVARLGGDEFVVLLPSVADAQQALAVGQKLLAAVTEPWSYGTTVIPVGASVGVACFEGSAGETPSQLLERADLATYAAKEAGRGKVRAL